MSSPSRPPPPRRSHPSPIPRQQPSPYVPQLEDDEPPSPLTYRLSLATQTVQALAERLVTIQTIGNARRRVPEDERKSFRCCCESEAEHTGEVLPADGCDARANLLRLEEDLVIAGEIGQALLQRYEALQAKFESTCTQHDEQAQLLATSYANLANLEKANDLGLKRYGEVVRKNEGLEKRLIQMHQTQTLSASTILNLRSELSELRRSSLPLPSPTYTLESQLEDSLVAQTNLSQQLAQAQAQEKIERSKVIELQEMLEEKQVELGLVKGALGEAERGREVEKRRREVAESRLMDLRSGEVQENPKVTTTDEPEIHQTLAALISQSIISQHTISSLEASLADVTTERDALGEECDELRRGLGVPPRTPSREEADEEKVKTAGFDDKRRRRSMYPSTTNRRSSWAQSLASNNSANDRRNSYFPTMAPAGHGRNSSLTPSWTSSAVGVGSPKSTMGILRPAGDSGIVQDADSGRERQATVRASEAWSPTIPEEKRGGLRYSINGVVRKRDGDKESEKRDRRSWTADRPKAFDRSFSGPQGVESIAEWSQDHPDAEPSPSAEISSPLSESQSSTFRTKRMSSIRYNSGRPLRPLELRLPSASAVNGDILSPRARQTHSPVGVESPRSEREDLDSPGPASGSESGRPRGLGRRRLMLVNTASKGVQTDTMQDSIRGLGITGTVTEPAAGSSAFSYAAISASTSVNTTVTMEQAGFASAEDRQESAFAMDARSGALLLVIDHMSKILLKLRQADVATLTKRLRKQHLPGDVGHLSATTVDKLKSEIGELRAYFKAVLEQEKDKRSHHLRDPALANTESAVTRKDLMLLLKLFRELFTELVELRGTVNAVTLDPASAVKLKEEAAKEDIEEDTDRGRGKTKIPVGGLGWMAPISRFFVAATPDDEAAMAKSIDRGRIPPAKMAPKQSAVTSATTTNVSVEFGAAGLIKRSTASMPVAHADKVDGLPPSPSDESTHTTHTTKTPPIGAVTRPSAPTLGDGTLRPGPHGRRDLLGIFAGASSSVTMGGDWTVIDGRQVRVPSLRSASSQNFAKQGRDGRAGHKRQMSTTVDAMIDTPLPEDEAAEIHNGENYQTIMNRRLRKRGMSDSSIRTTIQSYAGEGTSGPLEAIDAPKPLPTKQASGGSVQRSGSIMGRFGRQIQVFAGVKTASIAPSPVTPATVEDISAPKTDSAADVVAPPHTTTKSTMPEDTTSAIPIAEQTSVQPIPINSAPTLRASSVHRPSGLLNMFLPSSASEASTLQALYENAGELGGSLIERRYGRSVNGYLSHV